MAETDKEITDIRNKVKKIKDLEDSLARAKIELRQAIIDLPWRTRDIAQKLSLSDQYISDVRHGRRNISHRMIDALEKLYFQNI